MPNPKNTVITIVAVHIVPRTCHRSVAANSANTKYTVNGLVGSVKKMNNEKQARSAACVITGHRRGTASTRQRSVATVTAYTT